MAAKRACPVCRVSVNVENLEGHLARVHPRTRVGVELNPEERWEIRRAHRASGSQHSRRIFVVGTLVLMGFLLAAYVVSTFAVRAGGTIHLDPTSYDFGDIGQTSVSTTFRIHNLGTSPLVLEGVSTSCMCTTARVVYAGLASPTFGYHDNPAGWSLALPPSAEANLEVFYDPTVHPELGHFEREVYILSSDPAHREAFVQIHVYEV